MKQIRRKPKIGDWFCLRDYAGGAEFTVDKIEHREGEYYVSSKKGEYCYPASHFVHAAWVLDEAEAAIEIETKSFEEKRRWAKTLDDLWHEEIERRHEIEEALGVDFFGPAKRQPKKYKGVGFLMKSTKESHQEVLKKIKKLKAVATKG